MENQCWTHPYDTKGRRKSFAEMATRTWKLEDDAFRSLAASVRDAGGYEKTTTPLAEFRWADFFRSVFAYPNSEQEYAGVERQAIKLAKSSTAAGLPGFIETAAR
ncbi:ParB-like protein [Caballeronia sp. GAFFF2]|uniref:ParB-like protein n=1 Tax=Caballeronia sp. GAFFF2 TaxID=2921741 RepID=UPI002028E43E|nr:ParB-like protein [Caballeronia sp. GAFFF2]